MQFLLAAGAKVDANDLHCAAENGRADVVQLLLDAGVDVNAIASDYLRTALHAVAAGECEGSGMADTLRVLLAAGADVDSRDINKQTALHLAAYHRRTEVISILLSAGADVDALDNFHDTALHVATQDGIIDYFDIDAVKVLLKFGANVHARNDLQETALFIASYLFREGCEEAIELLIAAGADVDAVSRNHRTALFTAARNNNNVMMKFLLSLGADINFRDCD